MNNYVYKKLIEGFLYSKKLRTQVLNGAFDKYIDYNFISFLFVYSFNYECQRSFSKDLIEELKTLINYVYSIKHNSMFCKVNVYLDSLANSNKNKQAEVEFCLDEIKKRLDIDTNSIKNNYEYLDSLNNIKKSFDYDFEILNMCLMSEEEFNNIILNYQVNEYFFYSLNGLIKENPKLLEESKTRIMKLINNSVLKKDKKIKKLEKNIKNTLK